MDLSRLMNDLNDDSKYRFHLARTEPTGTRPVDVLARSETEWLGWQEYKGGSRQRFPKEFIVSFAQLNGNKFLFGGIFKITNRDGEDYEVESTEDYSELIGRLIIEYRGNPGQTTAFKPSHVFLNSRISGIYEHKFKGEPFKSYDEINHDFREMQLIIRNDLKDWKIALSKVFGIYLISNKETGKHYIGSAYGRNGLWGRWNDYTNDYHGGNKDLVKLFKNKTGKYFEDNFKFAVLGVISSATMPEEVINRESLWKDKLLTREFGYNTAERKQRRGQ